MTVKTAMVMSQSSFVDSDSIETLLTNFGLKGSRRSLYILSNVKYKMSFSSPYLMSGRAYINPACEETSIHSQPGGKLFVS